MAMCLAYQMIQIHSRLQLLLPDQGQIADRRGQRVLRPKTGSSIKTVVACRQLQVKTGLKRLMTEILRVTVMVRLKSTT
jgi:hypothetical protein